MGLIVGLICGPIGGLGVGSLNHITLVESISWKWSQFWKRTIPGSIVGLICGLILWLIILTMSHLRIELIVMRITYIGLIWLTFGLLFGLVSGLVGGFTDRVMVDKASPNQGIKLSRKNSLAAFLVTWLTVGLTAWLIAEPIVWLNTTPIEGLMVRLINGLIAGLIAGLIVGAIVGLNRGGSAVIKHYVLRLVLWLTGYTPFKFVKFLDHCARLILLKKVGGGYIFIHRMLLEYFAVLDTSQNSANRR